MDLGIQGKSALVVASSTGLGRSVAVGFGREGARVTLCARSEEKLAEAARMVEEAGGEANPVVCDIRDGDGIDFVVDSAGKRFGVVDILVTNCGVPPPGLFGDVDEEKWDDAYESIFLSVVRFVRAALPGMRAKGWGRIIPIVSVSAKQPIDNLLISNSLRPGVVGLAKSLSVELASSGITVNCIAPGYTKTDRLEELAGYRAEKTGKTGLKMDDVFREWEESIPVGRLGKPEELADLALFLSSDRAAYLTGNTIAFDGGSVRGLL